MKNEQFTTPDVQSEWRNVIKRRSFLSGMGIAGATLPGALLADDDKNTGSGTLTKGDAAILRFLAAAELIETDLWQQYAELGGANGGNPNYIAALVKLDTDMPQYISDNTDDEISHAAFLNAYLKSKGAQPVNLDQFRTLPSTTATGARQHTGRLTTLQALDVDTSWYTRYRSGLNPDLGANIPPPFSITNEPAIPVSDADTPPTGALTPSQSARIQAIANTAGFHFAFIEQGGSSLYTAMSLKCSSLEVLRIVVSIGGVEVDHFSLWHDKAGNIVPVTDPITGVKFPDLNNAPFGGENFQTNLILPEPCKFLNQNLPDCSVIRPSSTQLAGAVAAVKAFRDDQLFTGQPSQFLELLMNLATAADAAQRQGSND